jgi:hypothetical protein
VIQRRPFYAVIHLRQTGTAACGMQQRPYQVSVLLQFWYDLCAEKIPGAFGHDVMGFPVHGDRHARMLALFHAEAGSEVDPVVEGLFLNKLLESLDHIKRTFNVAGAADTNA